MSVRLIHLRKLLKILYLPPNSQVSALRADIRDDIAKESGQVSGGGDFYGPFWADAKDHVVGRVDLRAAVDARISANEGRANLYPQLRDGFLSWWDERRRWTNAPFSPVDAPKARYAFQALQAVVKVENFLSVSDSNGRYHHTYPYFSPNPVLGEEAARLGLWLIGRAVPAMNWDEVRILDVIRGQTYSADRNPLIGNEEVLFERRYRALIDQWNHLRQEYQ